MKKRVLSALLALCLLFTGLPINVLAIDSGEVFLVEDDIQELSNAQEIWDGTIADSYAEGSGTAGDPYQISNGAQLARFAEQVNSGAETWKYYTLTDDIYLNDISSVDSWNANPPQNSWTPIGTAEKQFCGVFNGARHTVYGIYISTNESNQGLFGVGEQASTIDYVSVDKSYIKGGNSVAGICGLKYRAIGKATVRECNNGATIIGVDGVGGIIGNTTGDINYGFNNCHNTGNITGNNSVGGIVGDCIIGNL